MGGETKKGWRRIVMAYAPFSHFWFISLDISKYPLFSQISVVYFNTVTLA